MPASPGLWVIRGLILHHCLNIYSSKIDELDRQVTRGLKIILRWLIYGLFSWGSSQMVAWSWAVLLAYCWPSKAREKRYVVLGKSFSEMPPPLFHSFTNSHARTAIPKPVAPAQSNILYPLDISWNLFPHSMSFPVSSKSLRSLSIGFMSELTSLGNSL